MYKSAIFKHYDDAECKAIKTVYLLPKKIKFSLSVISSVVMSTDVSCSNYSISIESTGIDKEAKFDVEMTFAVEGKRYFYLYLVSMLSGHVTTI